MIYPAWSKGGKATKGARRGPGPWEVQKDLFEPRGGGNRDMSGEFPWSGDAPDLFPHLWEEKSLLEAIQEAQNISLILERRSKQSWVRLTL